MIDIKQGLKAWETIREGRTIEEIVRRAVNNVEPITATTPIIHTSRADGVAPQYDIRTDRWDIAAEAMEKVAASKMAKRDEWLKKMNTELGNEKGNQDSAN